MEISSPAVIDAIQDDRPAMTLAVVLCSSEAQRIASRQAFEEPASAVTGPFFGWCLPGGAGSPH
jgi:hypothetical protein